MDQKLLSALNNLSDGLEAIAEALKNSGEKKSATTSALQGGNFTKEIQEINVGVKQLMKDSKQILKNQETIISLSKKSAGDKKSDFEKAGGDKKKESQIKKGIGTILLIAVAVLAIGMAFKLVGKIDFLSVVGLGLAMLIMSEAFAKIAKLKITVKEAAIASLAMVMMAIAVTLSSWVLKMISPIGMAQLLTGIAITAMFYIMAPKFAMLLNAVNNSFKKVSYADIIKVTVILVAMSVAITLSSWVLRMITPLSLGQIITGIGITVMFYVVSNFLPKLAISVIAVSKIMSKKDLALLPIMLVGFSLAITLSSWVLRMISPLSFGQIITGIAITAMFWIVSNFLPKLAIAIILVSKIMSKKDLAFMPLLMVAFSIAIMLSSLILKLVKPLSFGQIITTIVITAVFWAISMFLPKIAFGMIMVDKILGKNKIFMIPLVYIAISAAIMAAGFLFSQTPELSWKQMVGILLIGLIFAGLAYVMPDMAIGLVIMEKALGKGKMWLIPLVYIAIATAIMLSSHILNASAEIKWMKLLNILVFSVVLVIAVALIGLLSLFLVKVIGLTTILKGTLCIVALATAIMLASWLLTKGSYKKYPDWKWTLFAALAVVVFGLIGWLLMKIGSLSTYIKGGLAILAVATTVMLASHIINAGNYKKYPKLAWSLGVGAALLAFGLAAVGLGLVMMFDGGLSLLLGSLGILGVSATIVAASHILAQGKYAAGKYPSLGWSVSVGLALGAFGGGMVLLGGLIIASFGIGGLMLAAGAKAVLTVAETIVKSSHILARGNWKKGPTVEWASGVAIALGAFAPIYSMLLENAPGLFSAGGGVGPDDFAKAIVTVSKGIMTAAAEFASPKNKSVWKGGPTQAWATGVGIALGAFAPVYMMLLNNAPGIFSKGGGVGPEDFAKAVMTVSRGIIAAAGVFALNTAQFEEGKYPSVKWGQGVGAALNAFAPVFTALSKDTGWFKSGDEVITDMVNGVVRLAGAIVTVAQIFEWSNMKWDSAPSKNWSWNVGVAVRSYAKLAADISKNTDFFGIGLSLPVKVVSSIISVGHIIQKNKKALTSYLNPAFVPILAVSVRGYVRLTDFVAKSAGVLMNETGVRDVAIQMVTTAKILEKNKKYFAYSLPRNFIANLAPNLLGYAAMARSLEKLMTITEKKFIPLSMLGGTDVSYKTTKTADISVVNRVAAQMSLTAAIIGKNAKYFNTKIDPNFMKSVGSNLFYYMAIAKKLQSQQSFGSMIKSAFGVDPMSQMANGMIKLAKAYDSLASSIKKMGSAMSQINDKKISQMERMARLGRGQNQSKGMLSSIGDAVGNVAGAVGGLVSGALNMVTPTSGGPGSKSKEKERVGKYGNIHKQNDMIIELLMELNGKIGAGSNIDTAMLKKINEKKDSKLQ